MQISYACACGWSMRYQTATITRDQIRELIGHHQCWRDPVSSISSGRGRGKPASHPPASGEPTAAAAGPIARAIFGGTNGEGPGRCSGPLINSARVDGVITASVADETDI